MNRRRVSKERVKKNLTGNLYKSRKIPGDETQKAVVSCKQNSTVKILVSISCAARLLVRRPRGARGRVALRRGRPRHVWARGLTVNLNPGKEGEEKQKRPRNRGVNWRLEDGIRAGARGQGLRKYYESPPGGWGGWGGVWSPLSWVMRSTPPGPRNI